MAIHLNIELTDRCNVRCPMCSQSMRDEAHGAPERFMDWDTWRAALAGLEGIGDEVHLCPHWLGEPTIHPQFDAFVEHAFAVNAGGRLFAEFKLHTNAVCFGEERARLLLRLANDPRTPPDCFRFIHFSIDALGRDTYLRVKGADRRERVYANVLRFLELREELGLPRPWAHLAFVVQPGNVSEAPGFVAFWRERLEALGRPVTLAWDWPCGPGDAIYLRPLNCADQAAADRLHAATCAALGIGPGSGERLRAAESF